MDKPKSPLASDRDGTSQAQRLLPALLTDYVAIDEHSLTDQLALAHEFAKELKYFNFDNVEAGDWQGLINPDGLADHQAFWDWLKQIENFTRQPENYDDDRYYNLHRPHFVLFLTFLQLLKNTQGQLNQLTARHLEFYYRKVLNFTLKPPQPDRVTILAIPSSQIGSALLPAGTLLDAGKDSLGKDRVYSTDTDLIVNHAEITRLSSVYVNKQLIGIREARNPDSDTRDQVLEMLKIALGEPAPGDDIPLYPPNIQVDFSFLTSLQNLVEFVGTGLYMEPRDLRSLMARKNSAAKIDSDWEIINNILTQAGISRTHDSKFTLNNSSPSDRSFDVNLKKALGVQSLTNYFPSPEGTPKFSDVDSFYKALLDIETYFFMTMEDFGSLMEVANNNNPAPAEWDNIYKLLISAHQNKISAIRTTQLRQLRPASSSQDQDAQKNAVIAMMQMALGMTDSDPAVLKNKMIGLGVPDITIIDTALQKTKLTDSDWSSIYSKLQAAWLNRDPIPAPRLSEWFSIKAFSDALAAKDSGNNPGRWHTFGQRQAQIITANNNPPPTATLGWAISSPLLSLAQGQRTVALTLVFKPETFNGIKINPLLNNPPFRVELSSAKGWISAKKISVTPGDYPGNTKTPSKSLKWELTFDESAPAITPLPDTDENGIKTLWPALRLTLQTRSDGKHYVTDYPLFGGLLLEKVLLTVTVDGLTECKLQNDDQILPSGKPFEPFGSSPSIGSRLYFAHPELTLKKLDQLDITLQWMGVPGDNLGNYYQNYSSTITGNSAFKGTIALVDHRTELILNDGAALFYTDTDNNDKATEPNTLTIPGPTTKKTTADQADNTIAEYLTGHSYDRQLIVSDEEEVTAWSRYWFLELSGCDFQHAAYPGIASAKAIELAAAIANNANAAEKDKVTLSADSYKVNPPYTPKLKSFSLHYTASIALDAADLQNQDADQLYHLHPFGYAPIQFDKTTHTCRFLPAYDNEGELYIGLSDVQAPQTLSMLLQLAEGSANPDLEPATVQWSVLNGNAWQTLDQGQLQQDSTNGLLQSGIVKLQLDAVAPSTLLPTGLYWLRVAIDQRCDSVCDSVGFDTQAVTATFMNQENADDHYDRPLPAKTIENLVEPLAAISGITQPYTSYGARPMEQDSRLNNRISERLRHKQRAVSHWDYERLVLEKFPEIYKVKCIPTGLDKIPGQVTVVVIPDVRNRFPFDPFEPKAPASVLADIEAYLTAHAPMGVNINVKNAYYQPVRLRFAVRFLPGCDSGFYKQQLNEDVNHFLSPWAYEQGQDIVIRGKIYANAIIDFMKRRPYVDFVANLKFFRGNDNNAGFTFITKPDFKADASADGYAVTATHPDAVLVAVRKHDIDLVTDINFVEQLSNQGIGYMEIELDFQVG